MTTCNGVDAVSGETLLVEFDDVIRSVDPLLQPAGTDPGNVYVAPGFVDLQVNGFAGADFNSPQTPRAEIDRAIAAISLIDEGG